ncbi:hypothetical protein SDC9_98480 [bioreactor metagenome]|uniref:Uncharacterized protein n=1 Tax=bioreactor metagenome TaxID=1076179 RepID=A0A645AEX8_9ZZZZ
MQSTMISASARRLPSEGEYARITHPAAFASAAVMIAAPEHGSSSAITYVSACPVNPSSRFLSHSNLESAYPSAPLLYEPQTTAIFFEPVLIILSATYLYNASAARFTSSVSLSPPSFIAIASAAFTEAESNSFFTYAYIPSIIIESTRVPKSSFKQAKMS